MSVPERRADLPDDLEGVVKVFRQRWQEADREMLEHMRRAEELRRLIVERKTKAGRPLTPGGTDRLLRELEGHAIRASYLAQEAQKFCREATQLEERRRVLALEEATA